MKVMSSPHQTTESIENNRTTNSCCLLLENLRKRLVGSESHTSLLTPVSDDMRSASSFKEVTGLLTQGYGAASGKAENCPYEGGSIAQQIPHFKERGVDLTGLFPGTLNVSIKPKTFSINQPEYTFYNVNWTIHHPPETFSLSPCLVVYGDREYNAFLYYPHPETKKNHHQDSSTLEIICEKLDLISYGSELTLKLHSNAIKINDKS